MQIEPNVSLDEKIDIFRIDDGKVEDTVYLTYDNNDNLVKGVEIIGNERYSLL